LSFFIQLLTSVADLAGKHVDSGAATRKLDSCTADIRVIPVLGCSHRPLLLKPNHCCSATKTTLLNQFLIRAIECPSRARSTSRHPVVCDDDLISPESCCSASLCDTAVRRGGISWLSSTDTHSLTAISQPGTRNITKAIWKANSQDTSLGGGRSRPCCY
jgi:hypothetical protein